jgi:hypothetical protein
VTRSDALHVASSTGACRFWLVQTAHQLPTTGAMVLMVGAGGRAGGNGGLLVGIAVALTCLAAAYAPSARRHVSSRQHILDLWAMAAVILIPLFAGAAVERPRHAGMTMGSMPVDGELLLPLVLVAWALIRIALGLKADDTERQAGAPASQRRRFVARSVSAACCAASFVVMLVG